MVAAKITVIVPNPAMNFQGDASHQVNRGEPVKGSGFLEGSSLANEPVPVPGFIKNLYFNGADPANTEGSVFHLVGEVLGKGACLRCQDHVNLSAVSRNPDPLDKTKVYNINPYLRIDNVLKGRPDLVHADTTIQPQTGDISRSGFLQVAETVFKPVLTVEKAAYQP
jgi:hypothetical protein